jgi:site-specific DNA-methyltransferase (adenine-specific)
MSKRQPDWQSDGGAIRLYCGDCMDVMSQLPAGGIDMVFTSPPYNLGTTTGGGFPPLGHYDDDAGFGKKRGGAGKWSRASESDGLAGGYTSHHDAMPHDEYVAWQKSVVTECWRLLSDTGAIYYNHKTRVLGGVAVTPFTYLPPELPVRQVIIWARAGGINFSPAFYCPTHEWIVVVAKPDFRLKSKGASGVGDVWYLPQQANPDHPAPFPPQLPAKALETTTVQTVLDPFGGIFSTGVACVQHGRRFIGIEKSREYFKRGVQRIKKAIEDQRLLTIMEGAA